MAAPAERDEQLQNRALRHGAYLSRYSAGLSRRMLERFRPELRGRLTDRLAGALARVASRGPAVGPHSRMGLREGLASFDRGLRRALEPIAADTRAELRALADQEGDHEEALLLLLLGAGIAAASRHDLRRPVREAAFAGARVADHFREYEANLRRSVRREVVSGLATGKTGEEVLQAVTGTRTLRGVFDRAEESLAVRLETMATGTAALAREAVYEASPAVDRVLWIATLDGTTCPRCAALHGQSFPVGEGPRPALHFSCRCVTTPAGSSGTVVALDFSAWLRRQPVATQNDVLGATRARLFRDGKVDLKRFVAGNRVLTLEELRARGIETDPYPNTPSIFRS